MSRFFSKTAPATPGSPVVGKKSGNSLSPGRRRHLEHVLPILAGLFVILLLFRFFPLSEDRKFEILSEKVFSSEMAGNTLNLHYTVANPAAYNIEQKSVTLGNASLNARQQSCAAAENYLSALKKIDCSRLSSTHQLTYRIFYDYLETELSSASLLLYDEPLSPSLGIQAQLPVLLAEYSFRTKGDIEDYLTLLSQVPDYFASIVSFEQEKSKAGLFMSEDCALEVVRQCREFIDGGDDNYLIRIFNEKTNAITNLTADEKIAFQSRNKALLTGYVIPAYERLIAGILALSDTGKNEKGLCCFPEGTAYYEYLVKSTVGDKRHVAEIEEDIKRQMVEDYTAIRDLLSEYRSATGGTDITADASSVSDPEDMLNELRGKITGDFPVAPDVSCRIKYVHPSLQEYLSPAFYLTSAIDDYRNNVIYINPSGNYNGLELYTTLAHEGYPGHLYQNVYFNSRSPDLLRYLLDVGGYTEGWATYVEMYAYSLWEEDPGLAMLCQKNRSFTLGLASLLDIGIHYRGYSPEEVSEFLRKLGFSETSAASLYQTILQAPANYLKYYVGYLNFCRLRDELKEQQKDTFSLRDFHRRVLETGPAPFDILRSQILE
ncbi:MAG: DUF885 domain-containing protein [Candidatus Choladocola sp.]|nr:DUF885 domain-containing protein [Candidatus Choladocola sp.]